MIRTLFSPWEGKWPSQGQSIDPYVFLVGYVVHGVSVTGNDVDLKAGDRENWTARIRFSKGRT